MNTIEHGTILLLKSALTGSSLPLPDDFDLNAAYDLMKKHSVCALGYRGALTCGADRHSPVMQKLFQEYCVNVLTSERQMNLVQSIYTAFDNAGIDYMPVKGCILKQLYPEPGMRAMGDADILIRLEQYPKIRTVMAQLGFCEGKESDHELVWSSKALYVELHKRLIPSYNEDYFRYYGDGWQLATRSEGSHWYMSDEDQLVYLFTHFAKHYRDCGIGLRHVIDLWLFPRSCASLNGEYIHRQLSILGLDEFYRNIQALIAAWFEDGPVDDRTELIGQYIMNSGNWGQLDQYALNTAVRKAQKADSLKKGRLIWLKEMLFPTRKSLQFRYPFLQKHPAALPIAWVRRWWESVFIRHGAISRRLKQASFLSEENISRQEDILAYMGLHFDFKK